MALKDFQCFVSEIQPQPIIQHSPGFPYLYFILCYVSLKHISCIFLLALYHPRLSKNNVVFSQKCRFKSSFPWAPTMQDWLTAAPALKLVTKVTCTPVSASFYFLTGFIFNIKKVQHTIYRMAFAFFLKTLFTNNSGFLLLFEPIIFLIIVILGFSLCLKRFSSWLSLHLLYPLFHFSR